jgi:hypothetical protein
MPVAGSSVRRCPSHEIAYTMYVPGVAVGTAIGVAVCPPGQSGPPSRPLSSKVLSKCLFQSCVPFSTSMA